MEKIVKCLRRVLVQLRAGAAALTPYIVLEVFVPGGTVLAILLFLHRRKAGRALPRAKAVPAESPVRDPGVAQPVVAMAACCLVLAFMLAV